MFQALPCSSSGGLGRNCIYVASGIVTLCRWLSIIKICRVLFQNKINLRYCASGWFYYRNILRSTDLQMSKMQVTLYTHCLLAYGAMQPSRWCLGRLWVLARAPQHTTWCYPKISKNVLVITSILTLSPNFCHLRSSHLGLVYNDPSNFAIFGSTHWSLTAFACLLPVAILLGSLQWVGNAALSTRVSF